MSEIKPVSIKTAEERIHSLAIDDKSVWCNAYFDEVQELRAALEALQAENAKLKEESQNYENAVRIVQEWSGQLTLANGELRNDNAALVNANEQQAKRIAHQQYLIDTLMLEYCPDEMTEEQWENWKSHQRRVEL